MTRRRAAGDRAAGDGGSAALEMVVMLPVYMAFVMAVVVVGKLNNSSANIEAAARSAAREISLARNPSSPAAITAAEQRAREIVDVGSAFCTTMAPLEDEDPDPQTVTVTIECTVDLQQATFLGIPGTRTMTATASEIVDQYREVVGP